MKTAAATHERLLDVMIVTLGARGLADVLAMDCPRVDGVHYLVCCQNPDGDDLTQAEASLRARDDFELHFFDDRGSARNRNHAFDSAAAPYLLLADDDLRFYPEGLAAVIETLRTNTDVDIAVFRSRTVEPRVFSDTEHDLDKCPRGYYPVMFEIALRRESVERTGLRFSELTGVGAPYLCAAEEDLLLERARRAGLRLRYYPVEILENTEPTTCTHSALKPPFLRSKGTYMIIAKGFWGAMLRAPIESWRSRANFFKALYYYLDGCVYAVRHWKELT